MTVNIKSKIIHQKEIFAFIDRKDLEYIIASYVANQLRPKVNLEEHGTTYEITFEDATEGSPAYRVGSKAKIKIIQDFEAPPEEAK